MRTKEIGSELTWLKILGRAMLGLWSAQLGSLIPEMQAQGSGRGRLAVSGGGGGLYAF